MKQLQIKPEIFKYDEFSEFAKEFNMNERDLLFTHEFLYEPFMSGLGIKCKTVFQERYGNGEPSDEMVDKILSDVRQMDFDRVIAVGGGSVVDIAKLLAMKLPNSCSDWYEGGFPIEKAVPLIIIPTTCGTGSEVTNIAILGRVEKNTKQGLANPALFANYTVLIPTLVKGLPYPFFVYSSIDALIHATESFVSPKSNSYTELFAVKAIEMIMSGYKHIIENGPDSRADIIEDFLVASNFAGIAFGNTGVGAVHALSYPLGGAYHVAHGEANYEFFMAVFKKYYKNNPDGKIKALNEIYAGLLGVEPGIGIYDEIEKVLSGLIKRKPLHDYGMKQEECDAFAESVVKNQQRLLVNNYTPLSQDEIQKIFEELY